MILASQSPRRRELLSRIMQDFSVMNVDVDESIDKDLPWDRAVRILALRKAFAASAHAPGEWILSADTIVVQDGSILGKPRDREDARRMLMSLSGRSHQVATAYALIHRDRGEIHLGCDVSRVTFRALEDEDIEWYLSTPEPYDKAGAYGIQGLAAVFITQIQGDYTNVVGLPLASLYPLCKKIHLADAVKER